MARVGPARAVSEAQAVAVLLTPPPLFSPLRVPAPAVLASSFLLYALGLGAGAIPTAGALNWVLKVSFGPLTRSHSSLCRAPNLAYS